MRRAGALAAIVLSCAAAGFWFARASDWYQGNDLYCFWQGASLVTRGHDPYDETTWSEATAIARTQLGAVAGGACPGRYAYPLWTAVLTAPIGLLPLPAAATTWMAISLTATTAGAFLLWSAVGGTRGSALLFGALLVTAQPLWVLVINGQITGILLGLTGLGAWLLARGRDGAATATLAGLLIKPQVAGMFVPAVVAERALSGRRQAIVGAIATVTMLFAISLIARPTWIVEWLGEASGRRLNVAPLLPTAWGLSSELFGAAAWAPLLVIAAAGAVVAITRGGRVGRLSFAALALSLSLFAVPYIWSYDFLVLALPWAVALSLAEKLPPTRRSPFLLLTVGVASLLPWSLYALAFLRGSETFSAVEPVAAALLVATGIRLQPRAAPRIV